MRSIYFDNAALKSFSVFGKGGKSTIKIELDTSDRYELMDVLRQLDRIDAEQKAEKKTPRVVKKAVTPLALPAPPLALTYSPEKK
jgi:hypothetical protein